MSKKYTACVFNILDEFGSFIGERTIDYIFEKTNTERLNTEKLNTERLTIEKLDLEYKCRLLQTIESINRCDRYKRPVKN